MVSQKDRISAPSLAFTERLVVVVGMALISAGALYASDRARFETVAGLVAAIGFITAGALLLGYGRRTSSEDGRAFRLLGTGGLVGGSGMITFGVVAEFVELPAFGPLDIIFFSMYGLLLASLVAMPSVRRTWRAQARLVVDGLVGAISLSALLWVAVGEAILSNLMDLPVEQMLIGLTYPVLDLALLVGMMVVVVKRGQYRFDVRLLLIAIGFAFQVAADLSFLSSNTSGLFQDAEPNLLLFIGSALSFLLAGALAWRVPAPLEVADRKAPIWAYVVPYGIGTFMVAITVWRDVATDDRNAILTGAAFAVGFLVIVRQWLAIQENRVIVEKERRSLIASVSHELRTPLTSMIGFLTLLEDSDIQVDEEERGELLSVVLEQANYMGRMVTDIILLARDQPEKLTLTEQTIGTDDFVASILDTLGATDSRVEVEFEADMELTVDADRVRQIATNLLSNASKYGGGHALLVVESQQGDLVLEVHDDGPGVPKRYEDAIWERFERGALRLNSTTPGTGLGLAIVEMIAKAHQGTVGYRTSERLGGACFFVRLPGRVSVPDRGVEAAELTSAWQPASVRSR